MRTDRNLADLEQQWIAKYRAALDSAPVHKPRFGGILAIIQGAKDVIASKVGKVLVADTVVPPPATIPLRPPAPVSKIVRPAQPKRRGSKAPRSESLPTKSDEKQTRQRPLAKAN